MTNDRPWLISVCAGRWQLAGQRAAQHAGLNVFALDGDKDAPGLKEADRYCTVDIRDTAAVIAAVKESGLRPAGAVTFVTEVGMPAAAALRQHFNLRGPQGEHLLSLTDKSVQRAHWDKAGIPQPRWLAGNTPTEVLQHIKKIGFPAVIKPVDSAGSRGVSKIETEEECEYAIQNAFAASRTKRLIVESFCPGTEYTIETFGAEGKIHVLALTEKFKVPGTRGTVAIELSTPDIEEKRAQRITMAAVSALEALDYTEGPGHTEIIADTDGSPFLIESAGRGGGFMVFEGLIPAASEFDIATATALQAVGQATPAIPQKRTPVALRFFPSRPGIVTHIEGFSEANKIEGVQAEPFVSIGHNGSKAHSDGDRFGYILARGDSPQDARSRADRAQELIRFTTEAAHETHHH